MNEMPDLKADMHTHVTAKPKLCMLTVSTHMCK